MVITKTPRVLQCPAKDCFELQTIRTLCTVFFYQRTSYSASPSIRTIAYLDRDSLHDDSKASLDHMRIPRLTRRLRRPTAFLYRNISLVSPLVVTSATPMLLPSVMALSQLQHPNLMRAGGPTARRASEFMYSLEISQTIRASMYTR
ncbi:hypothetical protein CcaCcLH18_12130 [Colletotrichum camelliae]|nr:hypothetical protein CcaCcLH18_12130 [Colletotrichum camelliae]